MTKKLILLLTLLLTSMDLYAVGTCDNTWDLQACVGNCLILNSSSSQNPQLVDVNSNVLLTNITNEMTVEMWLKPNISIGTKYYVSGIWGPAVDKNDVWVLYINEQAELVFEVNNPNSNLNEADNTKVKANISALNNTWFHVSGVFDGSIQSAKIYINGILQDSSRNNTNPTSNLRIPQNTDLTFQIGSASAVTNNFAFQPFKGAIDEVRIWNKILDNVTISCQKDLSLKGNEANLLSYFRFNEVPNVFIACDATGKGNNGTIRSGAKCDKSDRKDPFPFKVIYPKTNDTLDCSNIKTITFKITDTSLCGSQARIRVLDNNKYVKEVNTAFVNLSPNVETDFSINVLPEFVGKISPLIYIERNNRCGNAPVYWRPNLFRYTELKYSHDSLDFKILKSLCQDKLDTTIVLKICNNTKSVGTNKDITISKIDYKLKNMFEIVSPSASSFPLTIKEGNCEDIVIKFKSGIDSLTYRDTLLVYSNDQCISSGIMRIPMKGRVEKLLSLTKAGDKTEFISVDFGEACLNVPTAPQLFFWENLSSNNIFIDSMKVPKMFEASSVKFPFLLEPKTSYQQKFVRFNPTKSGNYKDSLIIYGRDNNCTIRKVIYVSGIGIDIRVRFTIDTLNFGNGVVGQDITLNYSCENYGDDIANISFSLQKGIGFLFTGSRSMSLNPGETKSLQLTFRPISDSLYVDYLRFYEPRCYKSGAIPVIGNGILESFDFLPKVLEIKDVIACQVKRDSIEIKNQSSNIQNLKNFSLQDPTVPSKFKMISPSNFTNFTKTLNPNEKLKLVVEYNPNDLLDDRADKATINFQTQDNKNWNAKLSASSVIPKIFLTDDNAFGIVEIGAKRLKTVDVENISSLNVLVDSIVFKTVSPTSGFRVVYPLGTLNRILKPRDTMQVTIEFNPMDAVDYESDLLVYGSSPCIFSNKVIASGKGKIIPLEIINTLISFGFTRPCDCIEKQIPLVNNSKVNQIQIDSVWVDGVGAVAANPEYFSWKSDLNPTSQLPYFIPASKKDTLRIIYCPRSKMTEDSINHSGMLHIKSKGLGWENKFDRYLVGRQMLISRTYPTAINFPSTNVNNFAASQFDSLRIPGIDFNPDLSKIVIDSITFSPDNRVFTAVNKKGGTFPIIVNPTDTLALKIDFKPRAARNYQAKMLLHISIPCDFIDSTVVVKGSGNAAPFGMSMDIGLSELVYDSLFTSTCDTLRVPIQLQRDVPAEIVDIKFRANFDQNTYTLIGLESQYLNNSECKGFKPYVNIDSTNPNGDINVYTENFCNVKGLFPFVYLLLKPKVAVSNVSTIKIDSIVFDSKDLILYKILATGADVKAKVLLTDFTITKNIDFDTLNVLDCRIDTFNIVNTGEIPIKMNQFLNLQKYMQIVNSNPLQNDNLDPGQIGQVAVEYCPRELEEYSDTVKYSIVNPCEKIQSTFVKSKAIAPDFTISAYSDINFSKIDTIAVTLGDTVEIPIFYEKDLTIRYKQIDYWIRNLNFDVNINYNPYTLKFLDAQKSINAEFDFVLNKHGDLTLSYKNADSLKAGQIAKLKFLITVPDSISTTMDVMTANYKTDSLMFYNLIPRKKTSKVEYEGQCRINYLTYSNAPFVLNQNYPNPWVDKTSISFSLREKNPISLRIYSILGQEMKSFFEDGIEYNPGTYLIQLNDKSLKPGVYLYVLESGDYKDSKIMVIED